MKDYIPSEDLDLPPKESKDLNEIEYKEIKYTPIPIKKLSNHQAKEIKPLEIKPLPKEVRKIEVEKMNENPSVIANNLKMVDKSHLRNLYIFSALLIIVLVASFTWFNMNFQKLSEKDSINNIPVTNNNENNFTITNQITNPTTNNIPVTVNIQANITIQDPRFIINTNSS